MGEGTNTETGLSAKMALCLAAMTLVGIDGTFEEEELNKLRALVQDDETAFLKAFEFYNSRPLETCINVVAAKLTGAQKQAAYAILHEIALVDGAKASSEAALLNTYAEKFKLAGPFSKNVNQIKFDLSMFDE